MILPFHDYRRTHLVKPAKLHQGLDGMINGVAGRVRRRCKYVQTIIQAAAEINQAAGELKNLPDKRLRESLRHLRHGFRRQQKNSDHNISHALATLVEVAHRILGLRPYPVQVAGALALYKGYLVEMATGEGKSLTACLPAVLAGWTGRPCHIVTVNDYLSDRDAAQMRKFYSFCGVSVGCVTSAMEPEQRRENYEKGVVYTTSKELVADFLRDRLIMGAYHQPSRRLIRQMLFQNQAVSKDLVMRGLDTAIVDEADSVLIDEAVTPLIISRTQENRPFADVCRTAQKISESLENEKDYHSDLKYKEIRLTSKALQKIGDQADALPGIWRSASRREELIQQALTARVFYQKDKQYVVKDGKVVIVDEFTGRLMPDRTWRQGLHQAVEAKENLELTNPSETLARLSFQQFFRFFRKLSGMTGTAREAANEFWHIYGLPVLPIPTNRPCIRKMLPDAIYLNAEEKWNAVANEISEMHKLDRPVLVGTRSVFASEKLAEILTSHRLQFNILNAVRHEEEARIVSAAGDLGRITIATNMAGRGTDIKLDSKVAKAGGLHVIATERHESGRIDRQLFGRCARQGDPGSARAFMSPHDELIQRFMPGPVQALFSTAIKNKIPGAHKISQKAIASAQNVAQRMAYRQRKNVLKMDTWLEESLSFTGSEF